MNFSIAPTDLRKSSIKRMKDRSDIVGDMAHREV